MNYGLGVILNNHEQVAFIDHYSLYISPTNNNDDIKKYSENSRQLLVDYVREAQYLTVCPNDKYIGFWNYIEKTFRLVGISGSDIWMYPLTRDIFNIWPDDCLFSSSGNAFVCRFKQNFQSGLVLYDLETHKHTFYGCSTSSIGTDAGLNYFVLDSCNPYEGENTVIFNTDPTSGEKTRVTGETLSERLKQDSLVIDRQGNVIKEIRIPVRDWQGLALQEDLSGYVVLKDNNLSWYSIHSDYPILTITNCIENYYNCHFAELFIDKDQVLIQCGEYAVVADRRFGVIWNGYDPLSVYLKDTRILVIQKNENIGVILCDGTKETVVEPLPGFRVLGADIHKNNLIVAYLSQLTGNIEFQTYELVKLSPSGQTIEQDEIKDLTRDLENPDPDIREQTVIKLGDLRSSRALTPLIRVLGDKEADIRRQAVTSLSRIGDIRAVEYITQTYLGDRYIDFEIYIPVIDSRNNSDVENEFLAQAIRQFGPPATEILLYLAVHRGVPEYYFTASNKISWDVAMLVLWSLPDDSVTRTINAMINHPNDFVRYRFAHFLGNRSEEKATELLLILIGDVSEDVREAAVVSLGKKKSPKVMEAIVQVLSDQNQKVRQAAEQSLKTLQGTS